MDVSSYFALTERQAQTMVIAIYEANLSLRNSKSSTLCHSATRLIILLQSSPTTSRQSVFSVLHFSSFDSFIRLYISPFDAPLLQISCAMDEDNRRPLSNPHGNANSDTTEDATSFEPEDLDGIQSGHSESMDIDEQDDEDKCGKLKSMVWQHFEREKFGNDTKLICHYCKKTLRANSRNGTCHLKNHLSRCSKRKYMDLRQKMLTNNMVNEKKA
ncbi:hypothetical protein Ancab_003236 [Ancistrocladus abbreviatus]